MSLFKLVSLLIKFSCLLLLLSAPKYLHAEDKAYPQFSGYSPKSKLTINFEPVNILLESNVLDMGPSRRINAKLDKPPIGTRLRNVFPSATHNESNRFTYELIKSPKQKSLVNDVKKYLESLPEKNNLNLYSKQEQLAYWLNLYNITLINEIVKRYPIVSLEKILTGPDSLLDKKLVNIGSLQLSLSDIQYGILDKNYSKEPLIIYGLYQGYIGSPNINKKAFSGKNVYKLLKNNATDFVNSNRGTKIDSLNSLEVSSYYARNADYFPNFSNDLKLHLLQFADKTTQEIINKSDKIEPIINNWAIADLFGSKRVFGGGISTNSAASIGMSRNYALTDKVTKDANTGGKFRLSAREITRLKELMRVRAKNYGETSVTITDLELQDEN
ncbi:DUF547 domain-containing protein [Pseudoalteromonas sp. SR43-6]|jgi:hypothetical protein|uniref:DUF547 domain-containing protein n=1 Tax=Pseudoalteromonas TaxID=53246 RepID=UPI0015FA1DDF|nr:MULTISPECIES: DUF547 domain-containing protein [Pseudoalteromonas]MBB1287844.1 DUF547 domain-containing protein [Pseudoalteromonas sp. SR41-5]MBB1297925.1 DUF547 domain-containing protein [Pseudoalteromonas sp. SR41-7]MBB1373026.1 DUF547 domain-containing protein [Pseudoalteromonas sp. SR43-6]MBB1380302.1 DUF547 domain-containing protein [Pseudoalteromonas sp. SR43-2]MBB1412485.1 DUF547 domain-containing protein [Pseudoalteromonas sp. SG43-8]|tara:strand:+ start:105 stop:1262 length:1158 start_codon:yes stop_codon:yes gene_type:complete